MPWSSTPACRRALDRTCRRNSSTTVRYSVVEDHSLATKWKGIGRSFTNAICTKDDVSSTMNLFNNKKHPFADEFWLLLAIVSFIVNFYDCWSNHAWVVLTGWWLSPSLALSSASLLCICVIVYYAN
jgi:hypothetical protein